MVIYGLFPRPIVFTNHPFVVVGFCSPISSKLCSVQFFLSAGDNVDKMLETHGK